MLADTLRLLDLRTLTVSVQETDATTLLNFLRRLHGHPRQRPFIASAQINIFLSRNDPASDLATMSEEEVEMGGCDMTKDRVDQGLDEEDDYDEDEDEDEDDKGEGDEDEEDEDDGDEDEDDEDEDDEDEDDEDEDDEDEDDEDEDDEDEDDEDEDDEDEDDEDEDDEDEDDEDEDDEDEDDEDEDDEDEDNEDEDDEDEDDEDEMEPVGRLFFWTDPTWSECLGFLLQMRDFRLWTQKQLRTRLTDLGRVMPRVTRRVSVQYFHQQFFPGGVIEGFRTERFELSKSAETGQEGALADTPIRYAWRQISPVDAT
ncbi:hypothetical protein FA13DRAFT_1708416 [Coprinellus micaceus]|uniref:Uncharacterized protein n=1 Tax=Coprinellus micaceus TaxID=71717 RepID=A0A4Y7TFM7_COPMI|nr:hypothetical protein FA13DRAFT_1708416 [Coprinellus micaceus]